ncbi:hypothetical protein DPMN_133825 [Dreissena polymorpha]|uniref:Uncharacterized protein n=1 Tax=Dreissena polymorpha TaxID=45954 RepID=A0A9D4JA52_DREPO|nr:hypothetical protein DPMN_133825 [Dreissena polymorpha]
MMSDRRYPPKEEWHGSPSSDRSIVGRRKIDELQRQIAAMETDMKGRSDLIHKLNRLQDIEREKRVVEERVLERNNSRNSSRNESRNNSRNGTPRLLHSEMHRIIGRGSKTVAERLAKTVVKTPQAVESYIKSTVAKLPVTMDKIWKMREDLQQHYNYYKRPYNGELDIGSYEPWQVQVYFVCREIVNDVVEDFLNLYFLHDDVVEKGTYKQTESIAEKRAIHLIAEETILDQNPHEPGLLQYQGEQKQPQYAINKVKKRKITRKAGGEEMVEEVQEPEDEEE